MWTWGGLVGADWMDEIRLRWIEQLIGLGLGVRFGFGVGGLCFTVYSTVVCLDFPSEVWDWRGGCRLRAWARREGGEVWV